MPITPLHSFTEEIPVDHQPYLGSTSVPNCFPITPDGDVFYDAVKVRFQRLRPDAIAPSVSQAGDVAADLFTPEAVKIPARGKALIKTGIVLQLPGGFRARLQSRSGLALNLDIEVGAGLIDTSYRKEIGVLLRNHSDRDVVLEAGKAIANCAIERYTYPVFEEIGTVEETERSEGWGSSGR